MSNNSDTTKAAMVASAVGGLVGGAVGALAGTMMLNMVPEAADRAEPADLINAQQRFATGMNGDEDLGQDTRRQGKWQYTPSNASNNLRPPPRVGAQA